MGWYTIVGFGFGFKLSSASLIEVTRRSREYDEDMTKNIQIGVAGSR